MGCFPSSPPDTDREEMKRQKKVNREINRQIHDEKAKFRATHRLLLLGAGESGKSTIVKQMRIIHDSQERQEKEKGFSSDERRAKIPAIKANVREVICTLVEALGTLANPAVDLADEANRPRAEYVTRIRSERDFDYPEEFYDNTLALWKDSGIQKAYKRSNEFQLLDSAGYFLGRIGAIRRPDYLPTNEDLLRCRIITQGIYETKFEVNRVTFYMFDVGGQRTERGKWIQCFTGITAIIFVVACSGYDTYLREDPSKLRLEEAIELFESIWLNRWLLNTSMILFLNKEDLLREKIDAGVSKIEKYFSSYADYSVANSQVLDEMRDRLDPGESSEVHRAKLWLVEQFMQISWSEEDEEDSHRQCYPHFTTAIDTNNIKRVFNDCKHIITTLHLEQMGLL
ncbi:guanine nucleotide-binding protein G(s) subunit alpha-like [Oscarella lobularis]|uniref:guanine nucleotide-binding protein G(s) subunit alpha-like n=1 Tax=Oscarella lobularis TaxID=121494 RepID=UPI003313A39C